MRQFKDWVYGQKSWTEAVQTMDKPKQDLRRQEWVLLNVFHKFNKT